MGGMDFKTLAIGIVFMAGLFALVVDEVLPGSGSAAPAAEAEAAPEAPAKPAEQPDNGWWDDTTDEDIDPSQFARPDLDTGGFDTADSDGDDESDDRAYARRVGGSGGTRGSYPKPDPGYTPPPELQDAFDAARRRTRARAEALLRNSDAVALPAN